MSSGLLIGLAVVVLAGLLGGLAVVLIALLLPARNCPGCGEPVPRMRAPANLRQVMWGGWRCGCEVNSRGQRIK